MTGHDLPFVNACLNGLSGVLLCTGFYFIKRRRIAAHRNCMIAAFLTSCVFLLCYVYHKAVVVKGVNTPFAGPESLLLPYRVMLFSHIVLAIAIVPLAIITISRGLKMRVELHKKIARWTFPVWLYVSVTGVLIYLALYQVWPTTG
jgi:putative membrane protein